MTDAHDSTFDQQLQTLKDQLVVVDADGHMLYIGTLTRWGHDFLELTDADVHDNRAPDTTKEKYVHQARKLGHHANRTTVLVRLDKVFSLSRMEDVIRFA